MKKVLLIALGVVVLLIGTGTILVLSEPPDRAFARIQKNMRNNEWGKVYVNLSSRTRGDMSMGLNIARQQFALAGTQNGLSRLSDRDAFILVASKSSLIRSTFAVPTYILSSVKVESGVATLVLVVPPGAQTKSVTMIREHGTWNLDVNLNAKPNSRVERAREP